MMPAPEMEASPEPKGKGAASKFAHLVGPEMDDEEATAVDEEPPTDGTYDFKSCANDMMSAFQAGDIDALSEALEEFAEKVGGK